MLGSRLLKRAACPLVLLAALGAAPAHAAHDLDTGNVSPAGSDITLVVRITTNIACL